MEEDYLLYYYLMMSAFALILGMIIGGLISSNHWSNVCERAKQQIYDTKSTK